MDKVQFVKKLSDFLKTTEVDVEEIYLKNEETAVIRFINSYEKKVDIACDSNMAIVLDVVRAIMY